MSSSTGNTNGPITGPSNQNGGSGNNSMTLGSLENIKNIILDIHDRTIHTESNVEKLYNAVSAQFKLLNNQTDPLVFKLGKDKGDNIIKQSKNFLNALEQNKRQVLGYIRVYRARNEPITPIAFKNFAISYCILPSIKNYVMEHNKKIKDKETLKKKLKTTHMTQEILEGLENARDRYKSHKNYIKIINDLKNAAVANITAICDNAIYSIQNDCECLLDWEECKRLTPDESERIYNDWINLDEQQKKDYDDDLSIYEKKQKEERKSLKEIELIKTDTFKKFINECNRPVKPTHYDYLNGIINNMVKIFRPFILLWKFDGYGRLSYETQNASNTEELLPIIPRPEKIRRQPEEDENDDDS